MISWVLAALLSLPVPRADRAPEAAALRSAQLQEFATAIAAVSKAPPRGVASREWAGLIVAIGESESHFETRIVLGRCSWERRECDAATVKGVRVFRARGAFQVWRNAHNAELWDAAETDIVAQTKLVDAQLRMAFRTCARSGVPWVRATLSAYAGRRCGGTWRGLEQRLATYQRALGASKAGS